MLHSGEDIDNGGGYAFLWAGSIWDISVPPADNFCALKTDLKNSLLKIMTMI